MTKEKFNAFIKLVFKMHNVAVEFNRSHQSGAKKSPQFQALSAKVDAQIMEYTDTEDIYYPNWQIEFMRGLRAVRRNQKFYEQNPTSENARKTCATDEDNLTRWLLWLETNQKDVFEPIAKSTELFQ